MVSHAIRKVVLVTVIWAERLVVVRRRKGRGMSIFIWKGWVDCEWDIYKKSGGWLGSVQLSL